jgi:glycosyltransferase involved in cell wall biosynthesis
LLALFYSKIKKIRWIHIEHGSSFVKSGNKFVLLCANLYDRTLGRLVLSNANDIVAVSQSVFDFIKTLTSNKNMSVIYRGFDIEAIASIKPDEDSKKDREEDLIISFIGRLIAGKGVKDLLKAFSNIENKNVRGFIIGDGPERKNLEKLAGDLKIKDRVKFFGNVPYSKAISILKISDIFVNPSYTEGLPTTVLEAALCQKAIIATNVGGTNEIIKNNESGILIEPKNSELLKSKLEFLINNPLERERFGDNACRYVKNNFSWEKIIQKFIELRDLRTW